MSNREGKNQSANSYGARYDRRRIGLLKARPVNNTQKTADKAWLRVDTHIYQAIITNKGRSLHSAADRTRLQNVMMKH